MLFSTTRCVLVLALLAGFLAVPSRGFPNGDGVQPETKGEDLVIGMSAAFKGPSGAMGIDMYRGAMAYFAEINRTGGVHGRKIVLQAYNDGYDPDPAVANTIRLIEKDHALALFGYVGTPTVTRVLPLLRRYEDQHVFLFCPLTGAGPHRRPPYDRYVFNLRASYAQETAELVHRLVKAGRKRLAIFYQIDAYGRAGWDGVRAALAEHELRIVAEATYRRGATPDQSMQVQVELLRAEEPDAVICVGTYAACGAFIRDARDSGWNVPIANVSFVGVTHLVDALNRMGAQKSKDYTSNLINCQVVPNYERDDLPAAVEYRLLMDRHRPMPPSELVEPGQTLFPFSYIGFESFLNAKFLVAVLRKMGPDPRRERIREVVESMERIDLGINVPASFGPKRHQGLEAVYFTTVRNGRITVIRDWKDWNK